MKKLLNKLCGLVALFTLWGLQVQAGHVMWADINYSCVAPGVYSINTTIYRDCAGPGMPTTIPVDLKAPGCNVGRTVNLARVGGTRTGNLYCSPAQNNCNGTAFNFQEYTYSGTVIFSTAEKTCNNWVVSWEECCRPATVNTAPTGGNLYVEAHLDLRANNNSPVFAPVSSPFITLGQKVAIGSTAYDQDGDSLVFSIRNPLLNSTTPHAYTSLNEILYNADSSKYSPLNWAFNNTYPIVSYTIDWSQPMPIHPVKFSNFNPRTGSLTIIPMRYKPGTPNNTQNKYTLVTQVDEYRKINGVTTKIGTVMRDMYYVVNQNTNNNPVLGQPVANGQAIIPNDVIYLRPGSPLNFQFVTSDPDLSDSIKITSNVSQVLQGATLAVSNGKQPGGTITWTAPATPNSPEPAYFQITIADNACPQKAHQTYVFGVKITATGTTTGIPAAAVAAQQFQVYPNPFTQHVAFKYPAVAGPESIVIYNLLGQAIDKLAVDPKAAGEGQVIWANAGKFAAGTYVARFVAKGKAVHIVKFTKVQ